MDPQHQEHNANVLEDFMYRWNVVIDAESLAVAFQKLAEAGVLKLRSKAQQKFDVASQGYSQTHQDILDEFLKRVHLVHDPNSDETFENCAEIYSAMKGRPFTQDSLMFVIQYLQGKGVKLHWLERPSQSKEHRGHIPTNQNDFRFAPKEDSNHTPLSRHSHASDPRFNGELDREKMKRMNQPPDDPMAAHNWVWMQQAKSLVGANHSETNRVQAAVSQAKPGYAAYEAGRA